MTKYVLATLVFLSVVAVSTQSALPPPFPRANATQLLDTDRITVWNIVWPKGQPTAMHRHVFDQVGTYYARGGRLITTPDGAGRTTMTEVGSLSTTRKGTTHIEEGNTDTPLRAVFIELKKETASDRPADVGVPLPFPRDGAARLLDDDRVTVWDYTWPSGAEGLRYRPSRETVIVWLGEGTLRLTSGRDGAATMTDIRAGTMHHFAGGSTETVEMMSGSPRAMFFELK